MTTSQVKNVLALALLFGASAAHAQQPAPAATRTPPAPVTAQAVTPPQLYKPEAPSVHAPRPRPAGVRAAATPAPTPAPLARVSVPPDSVRPAPARSAASFAVPQGAAAQCRDGSFNAAPNGCAAHGGLVTRMPQPSAAPVPVQQAAMPAAASATMLQASQPMPPNATMRCQDGTWITGAASASRCAGHGGGVIFPAARPTPAPPSRQRVP